MKADDEWPRPRKPLIFSVDDDPAVSQALACDLRRQYGAEFQIVKASSGPEALGILAEYTLRDRTVACSSLSDQRMPEMTGVEFLDQARVVAPEAKLVLLTAYADTEVAISAINSIGLDYYLLKPWDPPEERLYPVLDDLLEDWRTTHPSAPSDLRMVGHRWSERSHDLKSFLLTNHVPYLWLDIESDEEARRLHGLAGSDPADLPLVLVPDAETLRSPSTLELATALGLRTAAERVSTTSAWSALARPAWPPPSTALPRACRPWSSSGRRPAVRRAPSAAIETILGFPKGLSGAELTHRAAVPGPTVRRREWRWPGTWSAWTSRGRCAPSALPTASPSRPGPCSSPPVSRTG